MSEDPVDFEKVYSALGSNERLSILRELNKGGSLSYTELKNNCGFVKKRESGRFAYHLRLLCSVNLMSLNKNTRKYSLSPFGRMVLSVTGELRDVALQSSGKIYVRTSRHKIEEFDVNRIYQSLIREANVPRDLASKITAEAESRISKLENVHLTAPLIRELVNSILVEKGLDEYRNKLTRMGLPVKDVTEKIYQTGLSEGDVVSLRFAAADAVFTDYLLLTQIGSEALDMHLSGDISIVNPGCWGIMPDSVFFDASSIIGSETKFGVKDPAMIRFDKVGDLDSAFAKLSLIGRKMLHEASDEIVIENFLEFVSSAGGKEEWREISKKIFYNMIVNIASNIDSGSTKSLSFQINVGDGIKDDILEAVMGAYVFYLKRTLKPRINLLVNVFDKNKFNDKFDLFLEAINNGGNVMFGSQTVRSTSYHGIRKYFDENDIQPAGTIVLQSLAINLPRLLHSGSEESYVKSLLKVTLQKVAGIMETRKNILIDLMEKKLLYVYEYNSDLFPKNSMEIVLNMVGLEEIARHLAPQDLDEQNKMWIKFIDFTQKMVEDEGSKIGLKMCPAVYVDESAERFYELDREIFSKTFQDKVLTGIGRYSQIPVISVKALNDDGMLRRMQARIDRTRGGYHVVLDISSLADTQAIGDTVQQALSKLSLFKIKKDLVSCGTCNAKSPPASRCPKCGSASIINV